MNSDIKISVIVPAYNVAQWLPRCVESILKQTHSNLEVLLIDDGSTDETPSIIDRYAKEDARIVAVHQKNAGLVEVRERGIALATGQFVGFVDGDDEIEPDMYARLLKNAVEHQADISQCGILYCFYDGRKKPLHGTKQLTVYDTFDGLRALLQGTQMEPSLCNKLYATSLLQDSCLDKSVLNNEDLLRNAIVFGRASRSVFEDVCLYHYWRRAESMSNNGLSIRNGQHILRARSLILDSVAKEVQNDARVCYLSALIGCYHGSITSKEAGAAKFRKSYRAELKAQKPYFSLLSKGLRYRAKAILAIPCIYNIAHKIHMKLLYAKIRRQAKTARGKQ